MNYLKFVAWSPRYNQISYEQYLQVVHPQDRAAVAEAINFSIANGDFFALDHRIVRPDGSIRYVYAKGEPVFEMPDPPADTLELKPLPPLITKNVFRSRLILHFMAR
jgi:hypothetical protein